MGMRAIGYIRVSTAQQADFGVSLDAQEQKVRAMAIVQGAELSEVLIDSGESGKTLARPGMERLLRLVDSGAITTVIVAKLDRLTRSVKDLAILLERFQKRGVALVSVAESLDTSSAAGRLVLNVMVATSQWEREAIGERTKDALQHKKASGQRVGTIPFGFKLAQDGLHIEMEDSEQAILRQIKELRSSGLTQRGVAATLNAEGVRTRSGGEWRYQYVASFERAAANA